MNHYPARYVSESEQNRKLEQLLSLLGDQVKSYQRYTHRPVSSSVPTELAQELFLSIRCTLELVDGIGPWRDLREGLTAGQKLLEAQLQTAKSELRLVEETLPDWREACRTEAVTALRRFIAAYDPLHLAHVTPDLGCFPFVLTFDDPPSGIHYASEALRQLSLENEILEAFPKDLTEEFRNTFCQFDRGISENQCSRLLINAAGKYISDSSGSSLLFRPWELDTLTEQLKTIGPSALETQLTAAMRDFCSANLFWDGRSEEYARGVIKSFLPRIKACLQYGSVSGIFLLNESPVW